MANTNQIRPWSRLASLRSPPDSNPKPQTTEPSLKTTNTSSSDKNSSATKSQPTSEDVHNPIMQSQKLKLPTPMTFPHAKLKVHPPPMVEEVTIEKPNGNASLKKESGETQNQGPTPDEKKETKKENETKQIGLHAKHSGYEGSGIRVITISGKNRGAEMQITRSHKKRSHKSEKVKTLSSPPMRAMYGNSNVQCVNNSMLLHTSLSHHDPGIHLDLVIPKKPIGDGFHLKKRVDAQRN